MRRVVITGLGAVSPIGTGRDAFFKGLRNGTNGLAAITRFEASELEVQCAGEVKEDLIFKDQVERNLFERDPKVGFALKAAEEALALAGLDGFAKEDLIHIGTSLETFSFNNFSFDRSDPSPQALLKRLVTHSWRLPLDAALRAIETRYGRAGLAATNCSACAVGLQTIGQAFHAVREGRFELALAGGFDSMINPLGVGGFQRLGAPATGLPEAGRAFCRPFDAGRSGLVLGEGAGFIILEEREKALTQGKTIWAEILGYGASLDASGLSAPDPEGDGAARAMNAALKDAGLPPEAIDHINAHGTGTHLNDPVEAAAIRRVFAGSWPDIPVTAIKSMTGHSIAAAGALEAIACIFSLVSGFIPPNIGLERLGAGCELNHVGPEGLSFKAERILSNSFGFGGQNTALILGRAD